MPPGHSFILLFQVLLDLAIWAYRHPVHLMASVAGTHIGLQVFHSPLLLMACSFAGVAIFQGFEQWLLPRIYRFPLLYRVIRFLLIAIHFLWGFGFIYNLWFFEIENHEVNEVLKIAASLWGGGFVVKKLLQRLNAEAL